MAPDAEILKRNRLPPSNWWAASPTVAKTNQAPRDARPAKSINNPLKDARPAKSKGLKKTRVAAREALEVGGGSRNGESTTGPSVAKANECPEDARPVKGKSQKRTIVATSEAAEVDEAHRNREKERRNQGAETVSSRSKRESGKRNRAPPSNWWATSPSVANKAVEPRKDVPRLKNKKTVETPTVIAANLESVNSSLTSGSLKRKRSRPSNWWEANTSSLLDSDESRGQDVASQTQNQLKDMPKVANWGKVGNVGGSQSKHMNSNSRQRKRQENATEISPTIGESKGKKRGRPPASQSAQNDEGGKENRIGQRLRKERRHHSSREEIVDVLTASSTFGKGRTKRSDPVVPTEGRSRPESSNQRRSTKGSKSSKTRNSAGSQVPAAHSQPPQKKAGRPSGGRSSQSKRRAEEGPEDEVRGNKRHRSDQFQLEDESEEEVPDYQRLVPVTRKVKHDVIEAKWDALPSGCIDLISDLLEATQRPVIARLKDENQRRQAKSALQLITRKLISKMKKGVPFPGAGSRSREDEFNFEMVIDRNRILEGQLTAHVDANKLLEETLKKEIALLESDRETLAELETNAKTESALRKEAGRKTHPLLQSAAILSASDIDDSTLGGIQSRLMPSLGNYKDDALIKVVQDIESHVDSLNGNVMQLAGIPEAMSKAKVAVQVTLYGHLESTRYEDAVLGGE